jgi:hypothetical protein
MYSAEEIMSDPEYQTYGAFCINLHGARYFSGLFSKNQFVADSKAKSTCDAFCRDYKSYPLGAKGDGFLYRGTVTGDRVTFPSRGWGSGFFCTCEQLGTCEIRDPYMSGDEDKTFHGIGRFENYTTQECKARKVTYTVHGVKGTFALDDRLNLIYWKAYGENKPWLRFADGAWRSGRPWIV